MSAQRVTWAEGHARKALEKKKMAHTISIVVVLVICRLRRIIEGRAASIRDVSLPIAIVVTGIRLCTVSLLTLAIKLLLEGVRKRVMRHLRGGVDIARQGQCWLLLSHKNYNWIGTLEWFEHSGAVRCRSEDQFRQWGVHE